MFGEKKKTAELREQLTKKCTDNDELNALLSQKDRYIQDLKRYHENEMEVINDTLQSSSEKFREAVDVIKDKLRVSEQELKYISTVMCMMWDDYVTQGKLKDSIEDYSAKAKEVHGPIDKVLLEKGDEN